jgi:hypothetical protein
MMLDYIDNINAYGDNVVRLYDFDRLQAVKFRQCLQETIIENMKAFDLSSCDFIEGRNCSLILCISEDDEGITTSDNINFYCKLTIKGYQQMIALLMPFCTKETKGHQYLYDVDSLTDFLFSPSGTW